MSSLRRVSIALVVVGGLAWAVWSFAAAQSQQPAGPDEGTSSSVLDAPSGADLKSLEGSSLAARYHLRKRTRRFFRRSTRGQIAGRYHLRKRTSRFFRRAVG